MTVDENSSPRFLSPEDRAECTPVHVVWELTLACDLKCHHCGSRAGQKRANELSTEECFSLIAQMARLGTRAVTLIGGEAYLRRDWIEIVRELSAQGIYCTLQTGGLHLTESAIRQAAVAGLKGVGVSIDGQAELHDRLRGVKGSFSAAVKTLRTVSDCGLSATVNTQITSLVIPQLPDLLDLFISAGARHWQVQLTVAMGRAADNPELLLQPYDLLQLMPLLAELFERGADAGLLLQPGNNIGYFGPYETLWRGNGDERFYWPGCNAGQNTLGIEADGTIKGCPSLPTSSYAGGNVRNTRLEKIWYETSELAFTRVDRTDSLWGFCRSCYYAQVCEGGCTWTSHSLLGRPGNNPYCHHRVLELSRLGLRERIVRVETAPGLSFDHGRFDLVLEHLDGSPASRDTLNDHESAASRGKLVQITSRQTQVAALPATRGATPQLTLCRGCNRHIKLRTRTCPHCGQDTKTVRTAYRQKLRAAQKTSQRLAQLLGG